jgi:L-ascorbate metabolism protein UlaG (beta-lactamase superfamily)
MSRARESVFGKVGRDMRRSPDDDRCIFLRDATWGPVPASVFELYSSLAVRGLIDARGGFELLAAKGFRANPHLTLFGEAFLLREALLEQIRRGCSRPEKPTSGEIRRILARVPELGRRFRLRTRGRAWSLTLPVPRRPLRPRDWESRDWKLLFDFRGRRGVFDVPGRDLVEFLKMFSWLNGDRTGGFIRRRMRSRAGLVERFFRFAEELGLLSTSARPRRPSSGGTSVRFVSHSSLSFEGPRGAIAIDPCRLPTGFDASLARVDAIFITHHHWDHCHAPTLARYSRNVPVYVPKVSRESPNNPSVANLVRALGFTNVRETELWKPVRVGATTVHPVPFRGEWFGPGSRFDGYCYLVEHGGRKYLGTVDSDRDEAGSMDPVWREVRARFGRIDVLFFGSSGQTHRPAFACGSPWRWSSEFERRYADKMRYHPDMAAVRRWCSVLRPGLAVPYAEFIFGAPKSLRRTVRPGRQADDEALFRDYWKAATPDSTDAVRAWGEELRDLRDSLRGTGTRLAMLAPGEAVPR